MSDQFDLVDARGRAAATAVRRNAAARALPTTPGPSRAGWVRPQENFMAAVSQAQQRAAELYQAEVKKLTAGLPLPFQLPI